jgi:hypothetical protein
MIGFIKYSSKSYVGSFTNINLKRGYKNDCLRVSQLLPMASIFTLAEKDKDNRNSLSANFLGEICPNT